MTLSPPTLSPLAVLWDIGNVIVRWDPRILYAKIFPDPAEREWFLANICTMAWHTENDRGMSMAGPVEALARQHSEYAEAILAWRARWWEMLPGTIPESEAAIEALWARGVPQFGLSNMCGETYDGTIAISPAFARLQDIVVSGFEGVIKPEPRIFQIACERIGLDPGQMLFVDDSRANIDAARALGFDTHLFEDPAGLRPALEGRGLL